MYKYPWISAFIFSMMVFGGMALIFFIGKIITSSIAEIDLVMIWFGFAVFVGSRFLIFNRGSKE